MDNYFWFEFRGVAIVNRYRTIAFNEELGLIIIMSLLFVKATLGILFGTREHGASIYRNGKFENLKSVVIRLFVSIKQKMAIYILY